MCERRWICRDESLLNCFPQKRQVWWCGRPRNDNDADPTARAVDGFGSGRGATWAAAAGRAGWERARPARPLADRALEDFSCMVRAGKPKERG